MSVRAVLTAPRIFSPGMNDLWHLAPQDEVGPLTDQFWVNHARGCSVMKNMYLIIKYVNVLYQIDLRDNSSLREPKC
jgi:hypothetical protein